MTKDQIRRAIAQLQALLEDAPDTEDHPPAKDNPPHARCSFCGKPRIETGPMVEGPGDIYICDRCVELAAKIVQHERVKQIAGLTARVKQLETERDIRATE